MLQVTLELSPYLEGAVCSVIFSIFALGPSFFYLLALAINEGVKPALFFALGIITSDMVIISAIYLGLGSVFKTDLFQEIFSVFGGLVICFFGIKLVLQKKVNVNTDVEIKDVSSFGNLIKGFFMNISNPITLFAWVTLMGQLKKEHSEYTDDQYIQFFIGFFSFLLVAESTKVFLANKIRPFLTERVLLTLNRIMGVIFIGVSIWFIYHFFDLMYD